MKTVEEIYETLKADMAQRAGFVPEDGCDLAVRLWAAAAQIQALEIQADWVLDQSFPQTAEGVYLDRHADMRGLTRLPVCCAFMWSLPRLGSSGFRRGPCVCPLTAPAFKQRRKRCSLRNCCTPMHRLKPWKAAPKEMRWLVR